MHCDEKTQIKEKNKGLVLNEEVTQDGLLTFA